MVGISQLPAPVGGAAFHATAILNGAFLDLNSLVPADAGWVLEFAADINNCGAIAGQALNTSSGARRAYLLHPASCSFD